MDYREYNPKLRYAIVTFEIDEEQDIARETLCHVFYGDSTEEIKGLIEAHKKTDSFFAGSFEGIWKNIKLQNQVIGLI